jgi:hypothetical protein
MVEFAVNSMNIVEGEIILKKCEGKLAKAGCSSTWERAIYSFLSSSPFGYLVR